MAKVKVNGDTVGFKCPGCDNWHILPVDKEDHPTWQFNGNVDAPTLKPSILMRSGHFATSFKKGVEQCWCTYEERFGETSPFKCQQCHSFVTDGRVQFLNDCSHELAGQTVEMPEIE